MWLKMISYLLPHVAKIIQWIQNHPWKFNFIILLSFMLYLFLHTKFPDDTLQFTLTNYNLRNIFNQTSTNNNNVSTTTERHEGTNATRSSTFGFPTTPKTPPNNTTPTTLSYKCDDFVMFANVFTDGRGLGNQIFNLAAGHLVAKMTNRRLAVNNSLTKTIGLEEVFDFKYERFNRTECKVQHFDDVFSLGYNLEIEKINSDFLNKSANKTILTDGFFQSWKYALDEQLLRNKYLVFKTNIKETVETFFKSIQPPHWKSSTFTRVGIHVRRGDVLTDHSKKFGYTTPSASYFIKAMIYFINLYKRVQFIIVTNDKMWSKKEIIPKPLKERNYTSENNFNITFSNYDDTGIDLAILAMSHHTIISTGTFGWWGGWISRGVTIYYKDWPKPNSPLSSKFVKEDFFPPNWIGMSD